MLNSWAVIRGSPEAIDSNNNVNRKTETEGSPSPLLNRESPVSRLPDTQGLLENTQKEREVPWTGLGREDMQRPLGKLTNLLRKYQLQV